MDMMNAALSGSLDEVEQVVKLLKDHHTSASPSSEVKDQTIVLVSSVMTWINTPKKYKKNFPKKAGEEGEGLREDESDTEDDSGNKTLYFTDKDF